MRTVVPLSHAMDRALLHAPVMAGRIDRQRRLCFVNPQLCATLGYPSDLLLGSRLEQTCLSELDTLLAQLSHDTSVDGPTVCSLHYHHPCLGERTAEVTLTTEDDSAAGWLFFLKDITESEATHPALCNRQRLLEQALDGAIQRRELALHYQPIVDANRAVLGMEALVRWQHAGLGLISPGDFMPIAERNGKIVGIGQWIMQTACAQLAAWQRAPHSRHWQLSVNISAREIYEPTFFEVLQDTITASGVDPAGLKLELTETLPLSSPDQVLQRQLRNLVDQGVQLVLDDYGTGCTSLNYVKHLPVSWLKIDRSFVDGVLDNSRDQKIIAAILALADSLDIRVVAEGVETLEQFDYLHRAGCHAFQGYLFGRPVPADRLTDRGDANQLASSVLPGNYRVPA